MSTPTTSTQIAEAFKIWAESDDNNNRAHLGIDTYNEYVSILACPHTKPPQEISDLRERQKWSNIRSYATRTYELVDRKLWRKTDNKYPSR